MQAEKLKSGKWRARAYNKYTGERPSFTADSKKEAERLARTYQYVAENATDLTVGEACDAYIVNRSAILSPNTIKDYRITRKCHIDGIENRKVSTIKNETMQAWINGLAEEGLSPKSIKNMYSFVNAAITAQKPSQRFVVALPKKIKKELQMPSESDIRSILNAVKGTNIDVPVRLAIFCCMRRGEIAALLNHPECVGSDAVTIKYNQVKKGTEWIEKTPKTYTSFRTVPCPAELIQDIPRAEKVHAGYITDHWIKLMKKMKMSYRFHDLRHFSASSMLTVMPTVDVEKFGGWRHGSSVLQDIYTYNIDESLQKSAAAWQSKIKEL